MMCTTINGDSQYKDFLLMDCYQGFDVGGATAFGINRQSLHAYIMRSDAGTSPNRPSEWAESAELITTANIDSQKAGRATEADYAFTLKDGNGYLRSALSASPLDTNQEFYLSYSTDTTDNTRCLRRVSVTNMIVGKALFVGSKNNGYYSVRKDAITTKNNSLDGIVPVLKQYASSTGGYIIYLNGLKIMWGKGSTTTNGSIPITFHNLAFYSKNSYYINISSNDDVNNVFNCYNRSPTGCTINRQNVASTDWSWFAIGY